MTQPRAAGPLAIIWLVVILWAGGYLGIHAWKGIAFRTDLLSLLPADATTQSNHALAGGLMDKAARRFVLVVGHKDRDAARTASGEIEKQLTTANLATLQSVGPDHLKAMGALYFPHRRGLLASVDRDALLAGNSQAIVDRALAQTYSVGSFADAHLLKQDPFLLFPAFLTALPAPSSRLAADDGYLSVKSGGVTWILITGEIIGDPYALDVQERFTEILEQAVSAAAKLAPGVIVKRTGAIFFAAQGSHAGLRETSTLGTIAAVGTIVLLIGAFRRVGPLFMNLMAVVIGIGAGLSANLWFFDEIHIATLLFGVGLTGVAVDYGIHYSATIFDPLRPTPWQRLQEVLPGITLGLLTTLIGYAILLAAPFPALRQVAVFSIVGLSASFLTVILWFPFLDRGRAPSYGRQLLRFAHVFWHIWENPRLRRVCRLSLILLIGLAGLGLMRFTVSDDVRRMQSLDAGLMSEQADIQALTGTSGALQFVAIEAADDELALQLSEKVAPILDRLVVERALTAHRGPADFVPSLKRQAENAALADRLDWERQAQQLGLAASVKPDVSPLELRQALASGSLPFLQDLIPAPGRHVIALDGVKDPSAIRAALAGMDGIRFLDPAGDFSERLGVYRYRAMWLIGLSALLMVLPLAWRYGLRGGLVVLLPPVSALLLTPPLIALTGEPISFFHMMGLILVLAIGVDYATFCAETDQAHRPVTMLAVLLDMITTLLSFGVLAFSSVFAVHAFGLSMLLGILIAFLLAPLAGSVNPRRGSQG
jgi:predicted exporter